MILALDVGNSSIALGLIDGEAIVFQARMATNFHKTEDEYAVDFRNMLSLRDLRPEAVSGAIISSVVPPLTPILQLALKRLIGLTPLVVGPGVKTGLNITIDNPGQLGSDLVAACVAATAEYPKPLVVVDMGTATVMSVVNAAGKFMGGLIAPGVRISADALTAQTSQLPAITIEAPKNVIATNTVDCMKSGVVFGAASMIDGLVNRIENQIGTVVSVIATGALARYVAPHCIRPVILDEDLHFKGLRIIYEKNQTAG